jgi:hypothetical protein
LPLGHATVFTLPDLPFLNWSYTNKPNIPFPRKNTEIFIEATEHIYKFLKRYRNTDSSEAYNDEIPAKYLDEIGKNFFDFTEEEGDKRHKHWLEAIANGQFGFQDEVNYIPKGEGSWKYLALKPKNDREYEYNIDFLSSNWKMFHDALQKHEFEITHEILPKYGICVA